MGSKASVAQTADAVIEKAETEITEAGTVLMKMKNYVHTECYDKDGNLKWVDDTHNVVVQDGGKKLFNVMFDASTQLTTWYMGLIDASTTPDITSFTDTMSSHANWTEEDGYDNITVRQTWNPDTATASSSTITQTNSTTADFTIDATVNGTGVSGIFITSANTRNGTTGTLWATAGFSGGTQSVSDNDVLKVTYTITLTLS